MKKVAWVFPGQGSQFVGMGRDLYDRSPAARAVFEQADAVLGFSLSKLCFEGPIEELTATQNAQPAILTVSAAMLATLGLISVGAMLAMSSTTLVDEPVADEVEPVPSLPPPSFVAGHSLGEYTALLAAKVLTLPTALQLVRKRGELMAESRDGTMAAVIGLDPEPLEEVIATAAEGQDLVIANYNAPGQLVISGVSAAVERAAAMARRFGAKRVVPLNVSAAFHSPLMEAAARALAPAISMAELAPAAIPVVANVHGKPLRQISEIQHELMTQITAPVRWIEMVRFMTAQGVDTFVEIGPGNVLTSLIKRIIPGVRVINLQNLESIESVPC